MAGRERGIMHTFKGFNSRVVELVIQWCYWFKHTPWFPLKPYVLLKCPPLYQPRGCQRTSSYLTTKREESLPDALFDKFSQAGFLPWFQMHVGSYISQGNNLKHCLSLGWRRCPENTCHCAGCWLGHFFCVNYKLFKLIKN